MPVSHSSDLSSTTRSTEARHGTGGSVRAVRSIVKRFIGKTEMSEQRPKKPKTDDRYYQAISLIEGFGVKLRFLANYGRTDPAVVVQFEVQGYRQGVNYQRGRRNCPKHKVLQDSVAM